MSTSEKKAKLRFVVLYAVSLLLIFVLVTAFWKKGLSAKEQLVQQTSGNGEYFMQFDTLLHGKLDQLDNLYAAYLQNLESGSTEATSFLAAKNELSTTLDSISHQASFLTSGPKKTVMEMIVSRFRSSLEAAKKLLASKTRFRRNS